PLLCSHYLKSCRTPVFSLNLVSSLYLFSAFSSLPEVPIYSPATSLVEQPITNRSSFFKWFDAIHSSTIFPTSFWIADFSSDILFTSRVFILFLLASFFQYGEYDDHQHNLLLTRFGQFHVLNLDLLHVHPLLIR